MLTAEEVVRLLELLPHPVEGGFFRETYRTPEAHGSRSLATAIYYLLRGDGVSEMHRLPGDEIYHFYCGDPLQTLLLAPGVAGWIHTLGTDLAAGQKPQLVIPGGVWQGSHRQSGPYGFTLIGATMAPGFDYSDYTRGTRAELIRVWTGFDEMITRLTPYG